MSNGHAKRPKKIVEHPGAIMECGVPERFAFHHILSYFTV
jgi:hypothetical protein